jgi:PilZ domain
MSTRVSSARIERRQFPRFRIVLPVNLDDGVGWTRDVSATGAYLDLFDWPNRMPRPGSHIAMELVLEYVNPEGPCTVACEGEVLRVEQATAHVGVALRISSYQLDAATGRSVAGQRPGANGQVGDRTAIVEPIETKDGRRR